MQRPLGSRDLWLALLLAFGSLALFGRARSNDFVAYDDDLYVTENPEVAGGLTAKGVAWAFTEIHSANWHPLTWLSHMLDVAIFGLEPAGHHATSVLLHAANAVLFFLFLRRATGRAAPAFFTAALFSAHPLRVESVAWVAERKDVLSGLFFFLVLVAWERHAREKSRGRYTAALLLFAAGLLAKPMLVTLPLILLLLDRWPLERNASTRELVLEKLPFFALALASSAVTWIAQRSGGATATLEHLPLALRLENAALACVTYLRQTFWPADLACFYPHPALGKGGASAALLLSALGAATLLASISIAVFLRRKAAPSVCFGWTAFLVMLVPVIGIVQVGNQAHADRYTYLPSAALASGLAFGLASLPGALARSASAVLGAAALVAFSVLTPRQVGTWKDSLVLWETAARRTEGNYLAHWRLGELYLDEGELEEAERVFEAALAIRGDLPEVQNGLGKARLELGDPERSLEPFERARRLAPREPIYALNLAGARIAAGELDLALALLEELARAGEDGAELHFDLGLLAQTRGDEDGAIRHYRAALERESDHRAALSNLGEMLLVLGDTDGAVARFERLVELEPADAIAHYNLGCALAAHGERARARESFRQALKLEPGLAPAEERLRALR